MIDPSAGAASARRTFRTRLLPGLVVLGVAAATFAATANRSAEAATFSAGGWTTSAASSPSSPARGATVRLTVTVTSSTARTALVDLEVMSSTGRSFQRVWDRQSFAAGTARTFTADWTVPTTEPIGVHTVKVGIFGAGWTGLSHWNDTAASFSVATASPTTSTTVRPTSTTVRPTTTTTVRPTTTTVRPTTTTVAPTTTTVRPPTTTAAPSGRFATLPPGSALPSGAACATRVRPVAEVRPVNATYNATKGTKANTLYPRVDGQFTGTTDEVLQWAACKWGIDEDIVRAQIALESWWSMLVVGDNGESFGLGQVRVPYHASAFVDDNAKRSSAYNVDYTYERFRSCYEGNETWLNTVERGATYAAGDLWGCLGVWFSGRWHTPAADGYIARVQEYLNQRIWTTPGFVAG